MTHSEDIKRIQTPRKETVEFLNARIEAMSKRIEYLEATIEVELLNKEQ